MILTSTFIERLPATDGNYPTGLMVKANMIIHWISITIELHASLNTP